MVPGLNNRETWMLLMMVGAAIIASVWNYYKTKWGLQQGPIPLWKFRKPILLGVMAGFILWCITQSGNVSPLAIIGKGGSLSHEEGGVWALVFGYFAESVVALTINRGNGKIAELLGKL